VGSSSLPRVRRPPPFSWTSLQSLYSHGVCLSPLSRDYREVHFVSRCFSLLGRCCERNLDPSHTRAGAILLLAPTLPLFFRRSSLCSRSVSISKLNKAHPSFARDDCGGSLSSTSTGFSGKITLVRFFPNQPSFFGAERFGYQLAPFLFARLPS